MTGTQRTLTIVVIGLAILLAVPIIGQVWAPVTTSEMMGGRRMVWGFVWLITVVLTILTLVAIGVAAAWRRLRH